MRVWRAGMWGVGNKRIKILAETVFKMWFYGSTTLSILLINWQVEPTWRACWTQIWSEGFIKLFNLYSIDRYIWFTVGVLGAAPGTRIRFLLECHRRRSAATVRVSGGVAVADVASGESAGVGGGDPWRWEDGQEVPHLIHPVSRAPHHNCV
jgi:hypothetical protein